MTTYVWDYGLSKYPCMGLTTVTYLTMFETINQRKNEAKR